MHRNLSVFTSRDIPLDRLFAQWQGKLEGFTKGRDRSFHFGSNEHHIVGMISHLGPQMGVACGIALSNKLKGKKKLCAVFTGDGGTSQGDFHESLNIASTWNLPVIFCIEIMVTDYLHQLMSSTQLIILQTEELVIILIHT